MQQKRKKLIEIMQKCLLTEITQSGHSFQSKDGRTKFAYMLLN